MISLILLFSTACTTFSSLVVKSPSEGDAKKESSILQAIETSVPVEVHSTSIPATAHPPASHTPTALRESTDPATWTLGSGQPDPELLESLIYSLSEEQVLIALKPVHEFFNLMYHSTELLTPERASQFIAVDSQAWKDPEIGFLISYDSFAEAGYFPYYEFPIEDPAHYTEWQILGRQSLDGEFAVEAVFRMEEQGFVVFEQVTRQPVVSTASWGPIEMTFRTAFLDGQWKIIYRHQVDLGTKTNSATVVP